MYFFLSILFAPVGTFGRGKVTDSKGRGTEGVQGKKGEYTLSLTRVGDCRLMLGHLLLQNDIELIVQLIFILYFGRHYFKLPRTIDNC